MKPRSIFVEARQWVDKTYGNSYFSARISVDGQTVGYLPFQYGYETAYKDAAFAWLQDNGYTTSDDRNLWELAIHGIDVYAVIYESKYKDTKRFGLKG